ncbi:hypothetical protein EYF80_005291 [Liparis tanakae]|uniref:Uncharacterized protein n=1 Tax=Liparis tanakae TaxID=230148 RepID=A0A4Z2J3S3_9TELE|nr:hypothetical protein EYF80_005291 [Liparis tanakae]
MCLSSSSADGRCLVSTKIRFRKSRQWSDTWAGSTGLVGWVAILKMAAMASNSAHGGLCVSISTTVQPTLLEEETTHVESRTRTGWDLQSPESPECLTRCPPSGRSPRR